MRLTRRTPRGKTSGQEFTGHQRPPDQSPRNQRQRRKEPRTGDKANADGVFVMPATRQFSSPPLPYIVILSGSVIRQCRNAGDALAFIRGLGAGEIFIRSKHQLSPQSSPRTRRAS